MARQKMTAKDLAEWSNTMRRLFRGLTPMDEELLRIALPRIAEFDAAVANEALEQYAIKWGGDKGRFIAASFLELAEAAARKTQSARSALPQPRTSQSTDMPDVRRVVAGADPVQRDEAVSTLRGLGWRIGDDPERWSDMTLVAVHDLLCGRLCPKRGRDGTWRDLIPASEFYASVPPPPHI